MDIPTLLERLIAVAPWVGGVAGLALIGQTVSWIWLFRMRRGVAAIEEEIKGLRGDLREYLGIEQAPPPKITAKGDDEPWRD